MFKRVTVAAYDPLWPLVAGIVGLTLTLLLTFTLPADLRAPAPGVTA